MDWGITDADAERYERKFFVSNLHVKEVETIVRLHPALFSEVFHERTVNNIYFDTHEHESFVANVDGSAQRTKVRIRWYGDMFGHIASPVLEVKRKNGNVGQKKSSALVPFDLGGQFTRETAGSCFSRSTLPEGVRHAVGALVPALLNSYTRRYFRSADGKYRITLDTHFVFYRLGPRVNPFTSELHDRNSIILELKYDKAADQDAHRITNYFPFRMTKSSKYVIGINELYPA